MAKAKDGVNKSELIRNIFGNKPGASAKDVVAELKASGIDATESLVYAVKQGMKAKKKKAAKVGRPKTSVAAAPSANGKLGVGASIALVKTTAEKVGGWAALKEIVEALA